MKGTRLTHYYTIAEAAKILNKTKKEIYLLIDQEKITPVRYVGRTYLLPKKVVENYPTKKHIKIKGIQFWPAADEPVQINKNPKIKPYYNKIKPRTKIKIK